MGLSINDIRDRTTHARHLMQRARQQHFAVGAFNIDNQETLIAISKAAQKLNAPVIIQVSEAEEKAIGFENARDMVDNYRSEYGVEMYLNFDHGAKVERCKRAIDAGFEMVHIDYSQYKKDATDQEIIEVTKEVVEYANFTGAIIESEPHYFGGSSNLHEEAIDYEQIKKTFSTPEGANRFIEETGIDTFAAAIGNLHGKYPVPKELDLELLQRIHETLPDGKNISLHGGSGTPLHYFEEASKMGVSKININSDMRYVFRKTLEKVLADNPDEYAVVKLMPTVYEAVQAIVEEKINAFGSAGKALK